MRPHSLPFFLLLCLRLVDAGSVSRGGTCNVANNRLEPGTYQFFSDCDSTTYCASNSTCLPRGCRRDIFPFGYPQDSESLPQLCKLGSFCPDEMDACQPLLPVNSPCQLNRDDQCESPPNFPALTDNSGSGLNVNGSVCLNNVCMWANATAGSNCTVENTAYIAYGANGQEFIDIVSRGNCILGLYCDSRQLVCMAQKEIGVACDADKECSSFNCLSTGYCGKNAGASDHFGTAVYIIVGVGIFGGMFVTLLVLFCFHRRARDTERDKRLQYWREQNAYRENIRQMRETAEASILSLPRNASMTFSPRSSEYEPYTAEDLQQPILQHAPAKMSGLRHHLHEENSSTDHFDTMVNRPQPRPDGRF